MTNFFHGWRRKMGCVLLVMACGLGYGSVRSFETADAVSVYGPFGEEGLWSWNGSLAWTSNKDAPYRVHMNDRESWVSRWREIDELTNRTTWRWRCCGFGVGDPYEPKFAERGCGIWIIPYWSAILPLTMFSAYLVFCPAKREAPHSPQS